MLSSKVLSKSNKNRSKIEVGSPRAFDCELGRQKFDLGGQKIDLGGPKTQHQKLFLDFISSWIHYHGVTSAPKQSLTWLQARLQLMIPHALTSLKRDAADLAEACPTPPNEKNEKNVLG